jgi:hypothetical protein
MGNMPVGVLALILLVGSPAPDPPVQCRIDLVWGVHAPGGHVGVTGWAVDTRSGARPPRVTVVVGTSPAVEIERGGPRPDVAKHFDRPDLLLSSFHDAVRIPPTAAGDLALEVVARSADGFSVTCGKRVLRIRPFPPRLAPDPIRSGAKTLLRAWLTVSALALAGALLLPRGVPLRRYLFSPVLGLAVLGLSSEAGGTLGLTPLRSFLLAGLLLLAARPFRARRRQGAPHPRVAVAGSVLLVVGYSIAGVLPMARQGDGVVMGQITDALIECAHADSLLQPERPGNSPGYRAEVARDFDLHFGRPGQSYLLAAMSSAEGVSTERVHSSAMLAGGITLLLTASAVAFAFLPRLFPLFATTFLVMNSVFHTILYTQHLANLLGFSLLLLFVTNVVALLRHVVPRTVAGTSLALAAGWTFYPEFLPAWAAFLAFAVLLLTPAGRRLRALGAFAAVVLLAGVLNPVGLVRAGRWTAGAQAAFRRMSDLPGFGDTHYVPPLSSLIGTEPYRLDAAAALSRARRLAAGTAAAAVGLFALGGFVASGGRRRRLALVFIVPIAAVLAANVLIGFPYGYSRGIVGAVVFGTLAILLLAVPLSGWNGQRRRIGVAAATVVGVTVLALSALSVRHVIRLNSELVPLFDPAFQELPALADALPRDAVVVVDVASWPVRQWIRYMLGRVETTASRPGAGRVGGPVFLLVDLRTTDPSGPVAVSTRSFAAETAPPFPKD